MCGSYSVFNKANTALSTKQNPANTRMPTNKRMHKLQYILHIVSVNYRTKQGYYWMSPWRGTSQQSSPKDYIQENIPFKKSFLMVTFFIWEAEIQQGKECSHQLVHSPDDYKGQGQRWELETQSKFPMWMEKPNYLSHHFCLPSLHWVKGARGKYETQLLWCGTKVSMS